MRVVCLSDLHGALPEVPDADLLLLAGDYNPSTRNEYWFLKDRFKPWIDAVAERMKVIGIAGNHERLFEQKKIPVPRMNWTYLEDSGCEWNGLKIFGQPWQPRYCDWAFNLDEPELKQKWELIPLDTDILIVHGPPRGCCDKTEYQERIGSPSLLERIKIVKPRLVVCGHNHGGYGQAMLAHNVEWKEQQGCAIPYGEAGLWTRIVNAAHMDDHYRPVNPPQVIEL